MALRPEALLSQRWLALEVGPSLAALGIEPLRLAAVAAGCLAGSRAGMLGTGACRALCCVPVLSAACAAAMELAHSSYPAYQPILQPFITSFKTANCDLRSMSQGASSVLDGFVLNLPKVKVPSFGAHEMRTALSELE